MSLQQVLNGDLTEWHGLPETATQEWVAEQAGPLVRTEAIVEKVRIGRRYRAISLERAVAPSPLEVWLAFDQDRVVLIEYEDAPISDLEALLKLYGEPETVLNQKRQAMDATLQEFVYAGRGITLSVGTPFESGGARRVAHVQLYAAQSLQYYLTVIGTGPEFHPY